MTDKDTPTPRTDAVAYRAYGHLTDTVEAGFARQLERETAELRQQLAEVSIDAMNYLERAEKLTRDNVELRQQLAALEQKRKEDVRKCAKLCELTAETIEQPQPYIDKHWWGNVVVNDIYISLEAARKTQLLTMAGIIRAAFPDVFKEKDNDSRT